MFGKAGYSETTKLYAGRGPDGMVNATLHEPKYPHSKQQGLDTVVDVQELPRHPAEDEGWQGDGLVVAIPNTLRGSWVATGNLKDTKWAPTAVLNVTQARNAGSPTGREPYGDGASVVVGARESLVHGEGRQVSRVGACGGTCDA